jgi:hypothetical protein
MNKEIYILKRKDDKAYNYIISSDSTNKPKYGQIVNTYIFPRSLNIQLYIKKQFNKTNASSSPPTFTKEELIPLRNYIMSFI